MNIGGIYDMKKVFSVFLILMVLVGCAQKDSSGGFEGSYPVATITMQSGEIIEVELYPDVAENTVNNFIHLAENNFYDGLIFHRVIPGFMIQGGDPSGDGTGGPGHQIEGEFKSNGFENDLKHTKGVISMARSQHPDSAGSQFFIMVDDAPHLDENYAGFGKVTKGLEVVEAIVSVERDAQDKPYEDQRIKTIEIKAHDFQPSRPKMLN